MMTTGAASAPPLVGLLRGELGRHADPARGAEMQRYMKTAQPFYGVPTPLRKEIFREARRKSGRSRVILFRS